MTRETPQQDRAAPPQEGPSPKEHRLEWANVTWADHSCELQACVEWPVGSPSTPLKAEPPW